MTRNKTGDYELIRVEPENNVFLLKWKKKYRTLIKWAISCHTLIKMYPVHFILFQLEMLQEIRMIETFFAQYITDLITSPKG